MAHHWCAPPIYRLPTSLGALKTQQISGLANNQRSARTPFSRPRSSTRLLPCPSLRSRQDRGEDFFLIPWSFLGYFTFFETNIKDDTRLRLSPRSRRAWDRGIFTDSSIISRSMWGPGRPLHWVRYYHIFTAFRREKQSTRDQCSFFSFKVVVTI